MKRSKPWTLTIVGLWLGGLSGRAIGPRPALAAPDEAPRLVLLVAVDQIRSWGWGATLATLLGIETPSGSSGETLVEILDAAAEERP